MISAAFARIIPDMPEEEVEGKIESILSEFQSDESIEIIFEDFCSMMTEMVHASDYMQKELEVEPLGVAGINGILANADTDAESVDRMAMYHKLFKVALWVTCICAASLTHPHMTLCISWHLPAEYQFYLPCMAS